MQWTLAEEHKSTAFLLSFTVTSMVITVLIAVEIVLKCTAFTVCGFWQSRRNRIDLLITTIGLAWCVLHTIAVSMVYIIVCTQHDHADDHAQLAAPQEVHLQVGLSHGGVALLHHMWSIRE